MNYLALSSLIVFTYLVSSIPFGVIVSKLKGVNLREVGSGNIGATNVYRALGIKYALVVFIFDGAKGWLPTYMAMQLFSEHVIHVCIGLLAIAGHSLSVFVKFKGGKGAATGLGVLMALSPLISSILAILAAIGIGLTRYVAPTTIVCSMIAPVLFYSFGYPQSYVAFVSVIALFIIWRHKSNIVRLFQGKENKV